MHQIALCFCLFAGIAIAVPYLSAHDVVRKEFGFDKLQLRIEKEAVIAQSQSFKNSTPVEKALRGALNSFMKDAKHVESPLALLKDHGDQTGENLNIRNLLNRPSTRLALVELSDFLDTTKVYPPEHGESLKDYWIFFLTIPDFSDHLFWALVSRTNPSQVYNYGFN